MRKFTAQTMARTAWAFASVGQRAAPLFSTLAGAAERWVDDFSCQNLADTARAFATAGQSGALLMMAFMKAVKRPFGELKTEGRRLANSCA